MNDTFTTDGEKLMDMIQSRRGLLGKAAVGSLTLAAGGLLAGCGGSSNNNGSSGSSGVDVEVLNFALNLEYLEAEFYLRAIGTDLTSADIGSNPGTVTGGTTVPFTTTIYQQFAQELAADERNHVEFLRAALGSAAVSRPNINFTQGFAALAAAAGLPSSFNPFADEVSFLLGSFVFEDVGVTAYSGASTLIQNKTYLQAAASILGTEAYHAGALRAFIAEQGGSTVTSANAIAHARATVDGTGTDDTGVTGTQDAFGSSLYLADVNPANSLTFARTTAQVLKIVYAGGAAGTGGGFYPNGMNGAIR